ELWINACHNHLISGRHKKWLENFHSRHKGSSLRLTKCPPANISDDNPGKPPVVDNVNCLLRVTGVMRINYLFTDSKNKRAIVSDLS
ncbi:MAG: hypothetical protein ACRC0J_20170, partial [Shewanella oncorhynchi]